MLKNLRVNFLQRTCRNNERIAKRYLFHTSNPQGFHVCIGPLSKIQLTGQIQKPGQKRRQKWSRISSFCLNGQFATDTKLCNVYLIYNMNTSEPYSELMVKRERTTSWPKPSSLLTDNIFLHRYNCCWCISFPKSL